MIKELTPQKIGDKIVYAEPVEIKPTQVSPWAAGGLLLGLIGLLLLPEEEETPEEPVDFTETPIVIDNKWGDYVNKYVVRASKNNGIWFPISPEKYKSISISDVFGSWELDENFKPDKDTLQFQFVMKLINREDQTSTITLSLHKSETGVSALIKGDRDIMIIDPVNNKNTLRTELNNWWKRFSAGQGRVIHPTILTSILTVIPHTWWANEHNNSRETKNPCKEINYKPGYFYHIKEDFDSYPKPVLAHNPWPRSTNSWELIE